MRKSRILIVCLIVISLSMLLLEEETYSTLKAYGDTLIIGHKDKVAPFNPIITIGTIAYTLNNHMIYNGLVKLNEEGEIVPALAQSWKVSEDGLEWIFYLRKGVKFHDGVEFTAADVEFTLKKILAPEVKSPYRGDCQLISQVIVIDKYTIKIILKKPLTYFLNALRFGILPKHLFEKEDLRVSKWNFQPIGTGPFKLIKYIPDEEIVLEANKEYFNGRPYLDKIVCKYFKDLSCLWAQLETQGIDYMYYGLLPEDFKRIKENPFLKTYSYLSTYYYMLSFNLENSLFQDIRIRKALALAIDKEMIIEDVLSNRGRVCSGPFYPPSWACNPEIRPLPYDPPQAIKLLEQAGWRDTNGNGIVDKNGREFEFTLLIDKGNTLKEKAALIIQQQLQEIGIKMRTQFLEIPVLINEYLLSKKFDTVFPEFNTYFDSDLGYKFWHSSQIEQGYNWSSYKNSQVDKLFEQGRVALDKLKRQEIYRKIHRLIADDVPGVFLFFRENLVGVHKRFRDVKPNVYGVLWNVEEWWVPKEEQKHHR